MSIPQRELARCDVILPERIERISAQSYGNAARPRLAVATSQRCAKGVRYE
jgi:hypothetical protein